MEIHIKIIGILLVLLAGMHIGFPKYFRWEKELPKLDLINRQMMYVHTFFIALTVFLMGILCIVQTDALTTTDLGKKVSWGLGVFWTCRLFVQFKGYSTLLWKGMGMETLIHILFILLWTYFSVVFWINAF
ncbi:MULTISPECIES: hypothetical protein [Chitinophagaceae]